jgi:chorismate synthase
MSTLGHSFRVVLLGTSRGPGVGVLVEGCPAGLPLSEGDLLPALQRRRGGGPGTTARVEPDRPRFLAGLYEGRTTGQPLLIWFDHEDPGEDGPDRRVLPRPGHADLAALARYGGFADLRGGGAFSGRLTVGLVAAGAVARRLVPALGFAAEVVEAGGRTDAVAAAEEAAAAGDSVGGRVVCTVTGVPAGLGDPPMDPLDARLAWACLCIPGVRAFEIGVGWRLAALRGSEANDPILDASGRTRTNLSGGVNGGITNGNPLVFSVAARPTASIALPQDSVDLRTGLPAQVRADGRNDACFALRLPVILESVAALVLVDFLRLAGRIGPVHAG